ncbi:MAG: COG1361 S-layer family protein [Christensenellales bacterium]
MKKFSALLMTVLFIFLMPMTALAEVETSAQLKIKPDTQVGPAVNDTYGNGYVPAAYKEGDAWFVDIKMPLEIITGIGDQITVTPKAESNTSLVPDNAIRVIQTSGIEWIAVFAKMRLTNDCINGTYPVTFTCEYLVHEPDDTWVSTEQDFTIYFSVAGKKEPASTAPPVSGPVSLPRVMLVDYTVSPQEVVAGGEMELSFTIKNVSEKRRAQNIKVTLQSEEGTFLPAAGTNAAYISRLEPGDSAEETFAFKVKPDALPKPSVITVEIDYEDSRASSATETAQISIPVTQPIRIKLDEPQVYGGMVGQSFSVSMNVYNMGKSTLYNVMAELQGEFITPEGSYYGGNMESGTSKTVELSAIAQSMGGDNAEMPEMPGGEKPASDIPKALYDKAIMGGKPIGGGYFGGGEMVSYPLTLILTYEDLNGKQYTEEVSLQADLAEEGIIDPGIDDPVLNPEEPQSTGDLTWLWIAMGAVVVAGITVLLVLRNKKKKRMIEDELL